MDYESLIKNGKSVKIEAQSGYVSVIVKGEYDCFYITNNNGVITLTDGDLETHDCEKSLFDLAISKSANVPDGYVLVSIDTVNDAIHNLKCSPHYSIGSSGHHVAEELKSIIGDQ